MDSTRIIKSGTILNGKYEIEAVLGEGGFGITYRAKDTTLNEIVAIKEYFPSALGTRDTTAEGSTNEITVISSADTAAFEKGLLRFENEAANLARFNKEPGIVSVKNFFKENNTGYMVMEYIDGITLKEYLSNHGEKLSYQETISLMEPIMESLSIVHKASIIHRDISPDNIMITKDGKLKLIDFGAARYVGNQDEKSLTVMLKSGYAPVEQYYSDGHQGTWTDVYALCATMYRMISGQVPTESIERAMEGADLKSLDKLCPDVPGNVSKAIEKGMVIDGKKRCKTVDELKSSILNDSNYKRKKLIKVLCAILAVEAVVLVIIFMIVTSRSAYKDNKRNNGEKLKNDANVTVEDNNKKSDIEEKNDEKTDENSELEEIIETKVQEKNHATKGDFLNIIQNVCNGEVISEKFDDFDGDGYEELFACIQGVDKINGNGSTTIEVWYVDSDKAEMVETVADGIGIYQEYSLKTDVIQMGKAKVFKVMIDWKVWYEVRAYTSWDGNAMPIETEMSFMDRVVCQEVWDNNLYFSLEGKDYLRWPIHTYYYPIALFEGEIGEIASCEISIDDFKSINGSEEILQYLDSKLLDLNLVNGGQDGETAYVERVVLDSVLYNDMGYFVINYKVYAQFAPLGCPPKITTDVLLNGNRSDIAPDCIAGAYAYAIVMYDGENLNIYDVDFGKYNTTSGTKKVVAISEFNK